MLAASCVGPPLCLHAGGSIFGGLSTNRAYVQGQIEQALKLRGNDFFVPSCERGKFKRLEESENAPFLKKKGRLAETVFEKSGHPKRINLSLFCFQLPCLL